MERLYSAFFNVGVCEIRPMKFMVQQLKGGNMIFFTYIEKPLCSSETTVKIWFFETLVSQYLEYCKDF